MLRVKNTFYAFYLSYSRLTILNIIWNLQVFASSGQFFGEHSSLVAGSKPYMFRFLCSEIQDNILTHFACCFFANCGVSFPSETLKQSSRTQMLPFQDGPSATAIFVGSASLLHLRPSLSSTMMIYSNCLLVRELYFCNLQILTTEQ